MPTHILRLDAPEVVRLLRAEIESEYGQPNFDLAISKEYIRNDEFDGAVGGRNRDARVNVITGSAVLTVDPHRERDYWALRVEVEISLRLRLCREKSRLERRDLTLDEFERELNAPVPKRIRVRLATETTTSRQHFNRWLSEMRKRHPLCLLTKKIRRRSATRPTSRIVSAKSSQIASRESERRMSRDDERLISEAVTKRSTARVERLLPFARKKLVTLQRDAPLIEAARLLAKKEANLVIICNKDGSMAGVIAKTDIVREICKFGGFGSRISISNAMTRHVVSCHPKDFLVDVWSNMKNHGLKHVPTIDHDSRPIGLAIARDVLGLLIEDLEHEEQLLRDYVMSVGYR